MSSQNMNSAAQRFSYRPDIDGLRAVAVIAVVLFHLGIGRLEGGFLGVDVFFVISGYLITSIIAPKIAAGTFSFKSFYLGRIRRLVPPALVTVATTFLASAIILDPSDLIAMAKSAIAAVFSLSNILFFSEAGYWDAQSELKPLLHTWSLGVEEQFYLFWPILILLFWKLSPKRSLAWAFGLATLFGLIVSEAILRANPSAAFYLLPARFFEFSIGATFAFIGKTAAWERLVKDNIRLALGVFGLIVLFATIWIYKGDTPFPGINAIVPCLATVALLMSGASNGQTNVVGHFLGNSIMTWIGRISYSLYLVHWPVVSLMRYKVGLELHFHHQIIAAALMIVLTLLLYYGVELRVSARAGQSAKKITQKSKARMSNGPFAFRTGLATFALSAVFASAIINSGWTWRYGDIQLTPSQIEDLAARRYILKDKDCLLRDYPTGKNCDGSKPLVVLVFGDSHERDGMNFLMAAFGDDPDIQFIRFGQINKCKVKNMKGIGLVLKDKECQSRIDYMSNPDFAKNIDVLFYASNRPFAARESLSLNAIREFKTGNPDAKIVSMLGYFMTEKNCSQLYNDTKTTKSCVDPNNVIASPKSDKTDPLYTKFMDITDAVVDRSKFLCSTDFPYDCESETPEGIIMMLDQSHHTFEFAAYTGRKFADQNPRFFHDLIEKPSYK